MISLVAYDSSSSENDDSDVENSIPAEKTIKTPATANKNENAISDADEDEFVNDVYVKQEKPQMKRILNLPAPSTTSSTRTINKNNESLENNEKLIEFKNLPLPKNTVNITEEEDDEFLRKKAIAIDKPLPRPSPAPDVAINKRGLKTQSVKITIPALIELDDDVKPKGRLVSVLPKDPSKQSCGLLNLLPSPKGHYNISKNYKSTDTSIDGNTFKTFIPDSVKNKQNIKDKINISNNILPTKSDSITITNNNNNIKEDNDKTKLIENYSNASDDSDDNDDSNEDFFSLNESKELPNISVIEINTMISKTLTEMSERIKSMDKYLKNENQMIAEKQKTVDNKINHTNPMKTNEQPQQLINNEAINALCGSSRAKRTKFNEVNVIDVSMDDILPERKEWLRSQLQQSTEHQPVPMSNVDVELIPGTKRKHQITYLAYQAKANEEALQATWANNRHARRQTQSKYGF